MGLILNNNNINKLYYGGSEVSKVYLGTVQVYPNQTTIQYIPNPAMTVFPNFQTRTIEGGRYLNTAGPSEYLQSDDYPLFSFGQYNPPEDGILFIRIYGQVTATSFSDFRSFYTSSYFSFFKGVQSTRTIQLSPTNSSIGICCNASGTKLSIEYGQFFCVDLMPTDQSLSLTIPKLRLCDTNGNILSTQVGTSFPTGSILTFDRFLLGATNENVMYGCPANKLKLDLLKSGIYYIAGDGAYLRDNPNEAVLFENRSIMIQNGG